MIDRIALLALVAMSFIPAVRAADIVVEPPSLRHASGSALAQLPILKARVSVIDGRTLWYPQWAMKVRLADVDACELPQWSFSPSILTRASGPGPKPVACGALSKAWLKRLVGSALVACTTTTHAADGVLLGHCSARGRDLGLEMLLVGWARVATSYPAEPPYVAAQQYAMSARYGMWGTYVLDMPEWRGKAVDRTLARRPLADANLLAERRNEISPPFADLRNLPRRTDR